ncbi:MAG: right-handed parallel beta-helix repeat-containing protein [Kiritimatiellae bacterium]|nr:right-handed parallel beta-helix repeat-containing protein [Kiritimatiellia bacterium]
MDYSRLAFAVCASLFLSTAARAGTVYVSSSGDGTDGASWGTAYTTLADAVSAASAGDTLILDDETFTLSGDLAIDKGVTITSRTGKDSSIIECWGYKVELKTSASTLDGVTFVNTRSGAFYSAALAVQVSVAGCLVTNCVFRQCGNNMTGNSRYVIYATKSMTASDCIITNNYGYVGTGLYLNSPGCVVENCLIADNKVRTYSSNYTPIIGIYSTGGNKTVIRNCTIANNSLDSDTGSIYALRVQSGTASAYENNVVWNNTNGKSSKTAMDWQYLQLSPMGAVVTTTDMSNWKNNCVTGADDINALGGAGNIAGDPLFRADGFSVSGVSPCIGAANANAPGHDVFGLARPSPATIGAVEYIASGSMEVGLTASASEAFTPDAVTLTALVAGAHAEPLTYAFDLDGDGTADVTQPAPTYVLSQVGAYAPSVVVIDANGASASAAVTGEIIVYDAARVVYVKADAASPKKPFMSEATATSDLNDAVGACPAGGTVLVAPGSYTLASKVTLSKAISVRGSGDSPTDAIFDVNKRFYPAVEIVAAGATLANITVYRGGTDYGNGLALNMSAAAVVSNCVFTGTSIATSGNGRGMAVASAGTISGCVFSNNTVRGCAGFYATSANVTVENCLVADNTAFGDMLSYGAATYCTGAATIRNCTVADNVCTTKDSSSYSAALAGTPGLVENCVFAGNTRLVGGAQTARNDPGSTSSLLASSVMRYCAIADAAADYSDYTGIVTDKITFAPGGYVPARRSSLVNAGNPATDALSGVDLAGRPRRIGRAVDIGCYECDAVPGLLLFVR